MLKILFWVSIFLTLLALTFSPAFAVLPNIFATQPSGSVPASYLDTNFTFLEAQGVQALTTTGSSNAYVATPADAWVTGYSSYVGRALTVIPNFSNTGAATINVSSLGTASIYKNVAGVQTALASGDITANNPIVLICDGTGFLLVNPASSSGNPVATIKTQFFSSGGTYTPCTGLLYADIKAVGGGGGGGGMGASATGVGGGGASGSYTEGVLTAATIGVSQSVTIGSAGAAGANTGGNGGTGGTTSFGAILSAPGGTGGLGETGTGAAGAGGAAGSAATGGDINIAGNPGGNAVLQSTLQWSGYGANSPYGGGGQPTAGNAAGNNGAGYGSGGSGASATATSNAHAGGTGAAGVVYITQYCSQ